MDPQAWPQFLPSLGGEFQGQKLSLQFPSLRPYGRKAPTFSDCSNSGSRMGVLGEGVGPGWEALDTSPDQPVGPPPGQGASMPPLLGTVSARRLGQAIVPSLRPVLWAPHFCLSSRPESQWGPCLTGPSHTWHQLTGVRVGRGLEVLPQGWSLLSPR